MKGIVTWHVSLEFFPNHRAPKPTLNHWLTLIHKKIPPTKTLSFVCGFSPMLGKLNLLKRNEQRRFRVDSVVFLQSKRNLLA